MLARENILNIKPYQPGKPIEEVQRELGLKKVIKMASNENAIGPSKKAVTAIKKSISQINRYPDGNCHYLKERLAQRLKVQPSNLIIGNGSDEIIILAVRAFLNEGDEAIIADRTFLVYKLAIIAQNGRVVSVPMKDFRYDLKEIKKAITEKTKLVFIANPDNPNGTYVTKKEVEAFLKGLPEDLILFFDEAYYEFVRERDYPDMMRYFKNRNLIIARTFSKVYGLSGLRVGYGISHPDMINYMNRVREPFNVNSLAQAGALAALDDEGHLRQTLELVSRGKEYIYNNLKRLGIRYVPSVTNFILIDVGRDSTRVFEKMLKLGVIIRDMKPWDMDNFIRVTVGTMDENKRFIQALEQVLRS
ncbi:MAG: histidinol-phosphate transaminase [Candidatus Omnitrophica bacterium]|nr:histidinol-phosphate transaminase [Candidatus Omnitrophota bacterium]